MDRLGNAIFVGEHDFTRFKRGMCMYEAHAKAVVVFGDEGDEFREKRFAFSLLKAVVCDLDTGESVIETLQVRHVEGCSRCTVLQEVVCNMLNRLSEINNRPIWTGYPA